MKILRLYTSFPLAADARLCHAVLPLHFSPVPKVTVLIGAAVNHPFTVSSVRKLVSDAVSLSGLVSSRVQLTPPVIKVAIWADFSL